MSNVIKKKKKSLLSRIIGKIKGGSFQHGQDDFTSDVPLNDICTNGEDINAIESRRNELRAAKHGNSDAMVNFGSSDV